MTDVFSIIDLLYSRTYLNVAVNLLHSQSAYTRAPNLISALFYSTRACASRHARAGGYVIGTGVHMYIYSYMFVDEKTISIIL